MPIVNLIFAQCWRRCWGGRFTRRSVGRLGASDARRQWWRQLRSVLVRFPASLAFPVVSGLGNLTRSVLPLLLWSPPFPLCVILTSPLVCSLITTFSLQSRHQTGCFSWSFLPSCTFSPSPRIQTTNGVANKSQNSLWEIFWGANDIILMVAGLQSARGQSHPSLCERRYWSTRSLQLLYHIPVQSLRAPKHLGYQIKFFPRSINVPWSEIRDYYYGLAVTVFKKWGEQSLVTSISNIWGHVIYCRCTWWDDNSVSWKLVRINVEENLGFN